jgi:hypothetical protein
MLCSLTLGILIFGWTSPSRADSASVLFDESGLLVADIAKALLRAANGVMIDVAVVDGTCENLAWLMAVQAVVLCVLALQLLTRRKRQLELQGCLQQ